MKRIILFGVLLVCLLGLTKYTFKEAAQPLAAAHDTPARCGFVLDTNAFAKICPYTKLDEITFSFSHPAPDTIIEAAKRAAASWAAEIQKPIRYVESGGKIIINLVPIDGRGGELGNAFFPSCYSWVNGEMNLDTSDIANLEIDNESVILHEFGHALGLSHSRIKKASMYFAYEETRRNLHSDDKARIAELYNVKKKPFQVTNGKRLVLINKEKESFTLPNFKAHEFASKCDDVGDFYIDSRMTLALQFLRSHYDTPVRVTSTKRSDPCNRNAGGVDGSQHLDGAAVDFVFSDQLQFARYKKDIQTKGGVFQYLAMLGITGFGTYATSAHLDTRNEKFNSDWKGIEFAAWNSTNSLKKGCAL